VATPSPKVTPAATASPDAPIPTEVELSQDYEDDEESRVPPEFATPEASLESFMQIMAQASPLRPDLYLEANQHLDLSKLSRMVREEQGVTLSKHLYSILKTADLNLEKLSVESGAKSLSFYRQPSGDRIEMVQQEDGRWVFSTRTVRAIPRMYKVLAQKGKIESWYIESLNFQFLGLNGNLWLMLICTPLIAYGLGSLMVMLLRLPLRTLLETKLQLSDEEQKKIFKPFGWLVASLFAWLMLSLLDIPAMLLVGLTIGVKIVATVTIVTAVFRFSDIFSRYIARATEKTSTKFDDMLIPLVRRSVKALVAVMALLFLAQNLNVEVWSLFAGFSIFGAMVALAGQDMVKNFFGSVTVLTDQPFAVGDWIVVNGMEGTVEEVGFRSTRIRTFYDSLITLPNSQLITASVDNYGKRNYRRYTKKLAIKWTTSPDVLEAFCEGIRELVRSHPYTRKDSFQVWVNDINDYSLQVLIYIFWRTPDWNTELRERHRFLLDLHRLAKKLDIEFAYPSQRLFMNEEEEDFTTDFLLEDQESARVRGKDVTQGLLQGSLPEKTPPPAVSQ